MQRLSRTFLKALLVFTVIATVFFISAQPASAIAPVVAAGVGAVAAKLIPVVLGFFKSIGPAAATVIGIYVVIIIALHGIAEILLSLGGSLVEAAINFNFKILDASFIRYGHNIVLGIANMGFIVALVVTAFGTMFRSEAFGYKKVLPKLIVAALLINFGFFIVTNWLISPVNDITKSFTEAANFGDTVPALQAIFDPRGPFTNIPLDFDANIPGLPDKPIEWVAGILAGTILGIAFLFLGVIALFAFAVMLLIRGIVMSFLIILLPIAWMGFVFPKLKVPGGGNPWSTWWESFIRWLLFAPLAIFFFYLAFQFTALDLDKAFPGSSDNLTTAVGQMLVTIGFMVGGLIIANKMGITGSGYALALASKGRVWGEVQFKKYGHRGRRAFLGSKPMVKGTRKLKDVGKGWTPTLFGRRIDLGKAAAPIRGAGRGVSRALEKSEATLFEEAFKKEMERKPPEAFGEEGIKGLHVDAQVARIKMASDNGTIWEIKDLEEVLTYEWEKIRARLPTQTRLKVEGQLSGPLSMYEHLKPIYEAKKKGRFKDEEWEEYDALREREGEAREAAEKATGLKKVDLTAELARIQTQREALESTDTVQIGRTAKGNQQEERGKWMAAKSRSGLVSAEPELMEKRYDEEGNFKPFYGQTEATTSITRDAIQGARMEVRPDLLTSWNAKMFPDGLVFANAKREEKIGETNQILRRLLALEKHEDNISELKREYIAPAIINKWPDQARWSTLIAEIRRTSPQEVPRYEAAMSQGAEAFATRFLALLSRRRQLAQATYDLTSGLG